MNRLRVLALAVGVVGLITVSYVYHHFAYPLATAVFVPFSVVLCWIGFKNRRLRAEDKPHR